MVECLFSLHGRTCLVTGATRGIGRAVATRLVQDGARVAVTGRKQETAQAAATQINALAKAEGWTGSAQAFACHIGRKEDVDRLMTLSTAAGLGFDVLVCNAAVSTAVGPLLSTSDEAFRKSFDANVLSNYWLCQNLVPAMCRRGFGRVVVISSIAGLQGTSSIGAYAITKAADLQLVRNLAAEFGRHGVRANAIAPGLIKTDMARALWEDPEYLADYERRNPAGRIGTPDEIAGAVVFLASDAGAYVNGQTIAIDGGVTVVHQ